MTWKEKQRALSRRARMGFVHSKEQRQPGKVLTFRNGSAVQVQADGSVRRVQVYIEPQARI